MSDKNKSPLGLVFLIVFLDMVGFSIIFPLFPDMLVYYVSIESEGSWVIQLSTWLDDVAPGDAFGQVALFGATRLHLLTSALHHGTHMGGDFRSFWAAVNINRLWLALCSVTFSGFLPVHWDCSSPASSAGSWQEIFHRRCSGGRHHQPSRSSKRNGHHRDGHWLVYLGSRHWWRLLHAISTESVAWETGLAINPFSVPAMAARPLQS